MRVLIVGAGCTGAATAVHLRELFGDASIQVWEKARGAGGRYTTSRETVGGRELRADMGAQYASIDPRDADSLKLMEAVVKAGAAKQARRDELADTEERPVGWRHYQGTAGQNGIVKAMLQKAGAEVAFERRVSRLDARGGSWNAVSYDGTSQDFDAVIACVPGCGPGGDNLNKINGNWQRQLSNAQWRAVEVPHDARFAVALFLQPGHTKALAAFFGDAVEKRVRSDSVELLVWQSWKNGDPPEGPQVVVAHTSGRARGDKRSMLRPIMNEACRILRVPPGAVASNKVITWYQSQVTSSPSGRPCLVASEAPPLILAGDYFTSSTFSGCAQSAAAAAAEAARLLGAAEPRGRPAKRPLAAADPEPRSGGPGVARRVSQGEDSAEAEKRRKRAERFGMPDRLGGA
mmetsp:Transcript_49476/g.153013  ORF Transcript_49476/g.153013 Transcript_49476/m.153013 type:complete len:405 (-) Transcript_49476:7-1221(-)